VAWSSGKTSSRVRHGVRRLLPKRHAVRFEHLSYSIHVVRSEVKMQMVTRLHEGYRRVWTIGQFEVEDLISSANARIEIEWRNSSARPTFSV
jgi:hypothetical protein